MSDPPSPRTAAMTIQMRAMREHFERLLREQAEQFNKELMSQKEGLKILMMAVVMRMRGGLEGDQGKII